MSGGAADLGTGVAEVIDEGCRRGVHAQFSRSQLSGAQGS